ncbi:MAG: hypothetical protein ACOCVF_02305 [bacterium]
MREKNEIIEYNLNKINKEFWIDRSGKIHKFKGDITVDGYVSFHSEIASRLFPQSNRATDILFNLGWVMVGSTVYHIPIIHKKPTQSQINTLDKLGLFDELHILDNGYYVKLEM